MNQKDLALKNEVAQRKQNTVEHSGLSETVDAFETLKSHIEM